MRQIKFIYIVLLVLVSGGIAAAQSFVPPRPGNNTSAIATLWPMVYSAQATNAAQSTEIAALKAMPGQPATTATVAPTKAPTVAAATTTARPTATQTPAPTAAPSASPTPLPPATDVPPSEANCLNCVDPAKLATPPAVIPDLHGQPCPAWVHDQYLTTGPNGKVYRTFHLNVQPEGQPGAGCNFDHTHGSRDIRGSLANNLLPAYGYEADVAGMAEPHAGFKTEFVNPGECNELEGFCSTSAARVTVHMGTAGAGRLKVDMHTFAYDMIGDKGTEVHVRGMADTGEAATQCDPAPDTSVHGFRLIAMPRDRALACNIFAPYEVWQFHLRYGDTTIGSKFATFDGITVLRADGTLEPTSNTWPNGPFSGCRVDVYFGGGFYAQPFDITDAYGRQVLKFGTDKGRVQLDTVGKNTYKAPFDECGPVPYAVN